jgi:hypothetical protein
MDKRGHSQRVHQRRCVTDLAGVFERLIHASQRGFGIAKHPQREWTLTTRPSRACLDRTELPASDARQGRKARAPDRNALGCPRYLRCTAMKKLRAVARP